MGIKMKIAIFGGVGFIGTNIATHALKKGHKVVAIDNLKRRGVETNILKHPNYEFIHADIRCKEDFTFLPKDIDGIINLASNPGIPWSIKNPVYDFNSNALGALNILEFSRDNGKIPITFASTNKVYSDLVNKIEVKSNPTKTRYMLKEKIWKRGIPEKFKMDGFGKYPHSPYGCSKASADLYHQEYYHCYGVPTVVFRMSCIYGKYQFGVADQGWIAWFIIAKLLGKPLTIFGDGLQVRDVLYADDLAKLYVMSLEQIEKFQGEVFNVGGGAEFTMSLNEAIKLIDKIDEGKHRPFKISYAPWRHADHKVYISDITKISQHWKPEIKPLLGLQKTYNWIMENKELIERFIK